MRNVSPLCFGAVLALGCSGSDTQGPEHLTGSTSGAGGATAGATIASSAIASSAMSSGSGGSFDCDPPAAPGSIYELSAVPHNTPWATTSMCQYRGEVMLIVNTAAL